ncbi:hypothetical protein [Shewanella surugensis]|uniref:N-acetyltransferase domain-containing protein n=1 Tax=Shewanella surugensis TaxID=212020 RepID=A0ABT0LII5_9GAMM|nr:hypothetical protein [Shewanella surugensis]MCL1127404.1 hypothetical protein [Shewanella surugensis]
MYEEVRKQKEKKTALGVKSHIQKIKPADRRSESALSGLSPNTRDQLQLKLGDAYKAPCVVQRVLGNRGIDAQGKLVTEEGKPSIKYQVTDTKEVRPGEWEYKLDYVDIPLSKGWVKDTSPFNFHDETDIVLKEGQVIITDNNLQKAVSNPGTPIGESGYFFEINNKEIRLKSKNEPALNLVLKHQPLEVIYKNQTTQKETKYDTTAVDSLITSPYEKNGLGTLLVGAFFIQEKMKKTKYLSLSSANTAPNFWHHYGLDERKATDINSKQFNIKPIMIVYDPPRELNKSEQ